MKKFLLDILVEPNTDDPLIYKDASYLLNERTGKKYPIVDGLPNFMDLQENFKNESSEIHNKFDTTFKYNEHYENDAIAFDYFTQDESRVTRNERKRSRQSIINSVPKNAKTILDIGCGSGWVAKNFLSKNKQIISLDISTTNPTKVIKQFPHPNHTGVIADAYNLPFKNETLDCIIASEVIEHVYSPELFITNVLKKIRPGGKLILITPYNEKLEYFLCVHCNKPTPKNAHLHSFNEKNIFTHIQDKKVDVNLSTYCNKYFLKLRIYNLLFFLPFKAWAFIDKLANFFIKKPTTFLIEIIK